MTKYLLLNKTWLIASLAIILFIIPVYDWHFWHVINEVSESKIEETIGTMIPVICIVGYGWFLMMVNDSVGDLICLYLRNDWTIVIYYGVWLSLVNLLGAILYYRNVLSSVFLFALKYMVTAFLIMATMRLCFVLFRSGILSISITLSLHLYAVFSENKYVYCYLLCNHSSESEYLTNIIYMLLFCIVIVGIVWMVERKNGCGFLE